MGDTPAPRRSRRCRDGVQVLHQALEVGHLLGQLVGLVALRERNRVTAGGGGGAGGEGGKHLEGGKEEREREKRGEEDRVSQGSITADRRSCKRGMRRARRRVRDTEGLNKHKNKEAAKHEQNQSGARAI